MKMLTNKKSIQGITLLEVLITVLVVAIGMLGMAVLQVKTLSTVQESYSRSQAVALLEDATARIRANREFFATDPASSPGVDENGNTIDLANPYNNNLGSGEFYQWCEAGGAAYEPKSSCDASGCDSRELALADIDGVCLNLVSTGINPASIGASCNDRDTTDADSCSSGSKMTLYVAWAQQEREDAGDQQITNTRCQNLLPDETVGDGFSCAIVELVP